MINMWLLTSNGGLVESGSATDQDLLSSVTLAGDLLPQVSLRNLQVLPHLSAVLQEGQVAVRDADQLSGSTTPVSQIDAPSARTCPPVRPQISNSGPWAKFATQCHYISPARPIHNHC